MVDALVKVYKMEGIRGLYKGLVPGMLGVSHGAIQFMTYEEMKTFYNKYRNMPIDAKLVRTIFIMHYLYIVQFLKYVNIYRRERWSILVSQRFLN
jgi:hypothetical protein